MWKKSQLPFLLLVFLIGVMRHDDFLIFGIMFVLAIVLVTHIWNHYCFAKLKLTRTLTKNNIFLGEEVQYIIQIENRKILPMIWLQINDNITKGINFINHKQVANQVGSNYNTFSDVFSLKWYEKVTRKYHVKPIRRGYFTFGKGRLKAADIFGLFTQELEEKQKIRLLVYPRVLPIERFGLPAKNPFGRHQMNQWIYQDPANKVGVRPYEQGDRFNQINWKATARRQELQSNVIKPTMETKLCIVLNTRMMNNLWDGFKSESFELEVICAASVAEFALKECYQVGLLTNGIVYEEQSFIKILPGKSENQREKILKALAMIEPFHQTDIDQMIYRELPQMEVGTVVVFISAIMNQRLVDCLKIMQKKGYSPTVIKIGTMESELREKLSGIPLYFLDEERLWNEINNLQFVRESTG